MSTFDSQPDPAEVPIFLARGRLLAAIPVRLGYQPGPDDVVLMATEGAGRPALFVHAHWDRTVETMRAAEDVADTLRAALGDRSGGPLSVAVVAYGEEAEAGRRLYAVMNAAEATISNTSAVTGFQVDGERWRMMSRDVTGEWWALPGVPVEALVAGSPAPAASREEYLARFAPDASPSVEPVSRVRARMYDSASPFIRAESATRALDRLANREATPADAPMLAHYLSDPDLAHTVIAASVDNPARTDVLVSLYRGVPEQSRPAAGAAAAAALWLSGQQDPARTILATVPADGSHADQLARSVRRNIEAGTPTEAVAQEVRHGAPARVQAAEAAWQDSRRQAPGRRDVRVRDHHERLASIRAGLSEPLPADERGRVLAAENQLRRPPRGPSL